MQGVGLLPEIGRVPELMKDLRPLALTFKKRSP